MMVARVRSKRGLRPHRLERYMSSNDPDCKRKAADIIGLYLNPPVHAAVFSVDEKTAIQAVGRSDPVLPLSASLTSNLAGLRIEPPRTAPGCRAGSTRTHAVRPKSCGGTLPSSSWRSCATSLAHQPAGQETHVIADNLSAHKTKRVRDFLSDHPTVRLHFTPTYSSWLD